MVGFFVEDHDLPLVNISLIIRAGSYLDPDEKRGLTSAVFFPAQKRRDEALGGRGL